MATAVCMSRINAEAFESTASTALDYREGQILSASMFLADVPWRHHRQLAPKGEWSANPMDGGKSMLTRSLWV